jgi:hypothetical protein
MRLLCLALLSSLPILSCSSSPSGAGENGSITGTYTGIMQETGNGHVLTYSLAQAVTVTETDDIAVSTLTFTSSAFPSFKAIVLSMGTDAVDLDLVGVNSDDDIQLQEVAFTKNANGDWILIIQTAGPPPAGQTVPSLVQYASYDPMSAPPATDVLAVDYLDQMLKLVPSPAK